MGSGGTGSRLIHVDPELSAALVNPAIGPTITPGDIPALRCAIQETQSADEESLRRGGAVELNRFSAQGKSGHVPLVVLRPKSLGHSAPVVLFLHGGGLISGDATTGLTLIQDWACEVGAVLISVDYRLAPEHPFPAPLDDCFSALEWVASHGPEVGVDPLKIVLIGASAGGGLAAALALRARDQAGPRLRAQMLLYPMLDDRARFPSSGELSGEGVWDSVSNRTGWNAYLPGRASGLDVPYLAAASRAPDLSELPSTYIDVGTIDTFRDEVLDFGGRLARSQVLTEMHLWPGAFHGFDNAVPLAAISKSADYARRQWLHRALDRS